jgi:hypothetical protein
MLKIKNTIKAESKLKKSIFKQTNDEVVNAKFIAFLCYVILLNNKY